MGMNVVAVLYSTVVIGVLLYFMFVTRRTILRVLGWAVGIFTIVPIFFGLIIFLLYVLLNPETVGMKRARIVNDLRGLSNAALLFYSEYKTWPLPGQEASLDAYLDRPIVLAEPPIYAKVMLADKSGDAGGMPELYIGVELIPEKNGTEDVQRVLSATANGTGLLQQPATHDIYSIYRSGLIVYIRIYGMEGAIAINDLQYLSEAARRFYEEYETWPVPGQEASLDAYCDRPIVLAEPPRYAKVTLTDKSGDANSPPEIYIGVESISAKYGSSVAEQFLARKAGSIGLLQQPVSGDIYKFGLSVYMRIQ